MECRRIVLAHSTTPGAVLPRFGGRVILIEVGLPKYYGGQVACLVIEKHHPYALHRGKKIELPPDSGPRLICYLKKAAALDPPNSRLKPFIRKLEAR